VLAGVDRRWLLKVRLCVPASCRGHPTTAPSNGSKTGIEGSNLLSSLCVEYCV
jgi:hypothetical protein